MGREVEVHSMIFFVIYGTSSIFSPSCDFDLFLFPSRLYDENPGEAARLCEALLEEPELDPAVRIGDAFGFLVDHHCHQGNLQAVTIVFLLHLK